MLDFIRLNLNALVTMVIFLIMIAGIYIMSIKNIKGKEYKRIAHIAYSTILIVYTAVMLISLVRQTTVNNIPRSVIDRSFTEKSQEKYENRVTGGN